LLQEKVNHYGAYALDGQMHREHPDSVGRPVKLAICSVDPVPPEVAAFIDRLRPLFEVDGLPITVERLHVPPEKQAA
jgi:hypothetical protein